MLPNGFESISRKHEHVGARLLCHLPFSLSVSLTPFDGPAKPLRSGSIGPGRTPSVEPGLFAQLLHENLHLLLELFDHVLLVAVDRLCWPATQKRKN